jgi:hypothetical protein
MSTLNRRGAHDALVRGTFLDRLEFEQLAHDLVDDLCNVTDAVAKQAVAQTHAYINHPRPSTSPVPSNETEKETLQARRVKALEAIALALTTIAKKETP